MAYQICENMYNKYYAWIGLEFVQDFFYVNCKRVKNKCICR
jgi:hypothetical protein